ncbi:MAG: reductive dehalogenase [Candidatus Kapaibacterium sp.]
MPSSERFDERDTMFAREEYSKGTEKYIYYYLQHPDRKKADDSIRALPELLAPGGKYYDPIKSAHVQSLFKLQSQMLRFAKGNPALNKTELSPKEASKLIKLIAQELGAAEVGIARTNMRWAYSNVGRGPEEWGSPIDFVHDYVVAFSLEMKYEKVEEAPYIGITEETARGYHEVQKISIALAEFIRELGYGARAQIPGSNYQLILPAVAWEAGLGELGRHGYLISPRLGSRIRLGAITTNLPLTIDKPISFGVQEFCEICKKCADNCPSGSIPLGPKTNIRGVMKWQMNMESCFKYWRIIGTDCGLCMKVCPFSHPDTITHKLIKYGIARSSFARKISAFGDDLFYGKRDDFFKIRK